MTQPSNRMSRPDDARSHGQVGHDSTINFAGAHHHNFGEEHHHKPTKAIIGVGMLVVLSFLLYEIGGKRPDTHATSAVSTVQHRVFASSQAN